MNYLHGNLTRQTKCKFSLLFESRNMEWNDRKTIDQNRGDAAKAVRILNNIEHEILFQMSNYKAP